MPHTTDAAAGDGSEPPMFVDRAAESGLTFVHFNGMTGRFYFPEMTCSGGAFFDFDADGDLDVYLPQGGMLDDAPPTRATFPPRGPLRDALFRNDLEIGAGGARALRFTDVTADAGIDGTGYGMGTATGDFDNDGWIDLYVTNFGPNQLLRNNGDGTFTDVTAASGTGDDRWSVSAAFVDLDRDGWLDLFVGDYVEFTVQSHKQCRTIAGAPDYCGPLAYHPQPDRLFRNRGDGTFEERSVAAGLTTEFGAALGVAVADFNRDGWLDLYVANDGTPNQMWINQGDGTLRNEALFAGTAVNAMGEPEASMGVAIADLDDDGDEDIFLTHLIRETNTFYLNDGRGLFQDATAISGLGSPSWSYTGFGTAWIDVDNDGRLDLATANGAVKVIEELEALREPYPLHQPNQLFRSLGGGRFEEITARAGPVFALSEVSRGLATGDVDNDGDEDLLLVNNSGPARLLINEVGNRNPWLGLRLVTGTPPRDALGAEVVVERQGRPSIHRRVTTSGSYASARDPRLIVGLGDTARVDRVVVRWPDGRVEAFTPPVGEITNLAAGTGVALAETP